MRTRTLFGVLTALAVCGCGKGQAPQVEEPIRVKTMTFGGTTTESGQNYPGTIEAESGSALSFASMGTVQRIMVTEGQFVSRGQLVGVLDATSTRNAYDAAVAAKEQALDAQKRLKLLHDNGSLPEIKWVEAETQVKQAKAQEQIAKKGLADTKLHAPFSGYITKKNVEAGANVGPGVPVVQLVRIDRVKVKVSVPEKEIAGFHNGMTLRVKVEALGNRTFTAKVTEKNVSADALSRSYEVKAIIPNPQHELLPGMIAEVFTPTTLPARESQPCPAALPAGIVQIDSDNRTFVWTVVNGKAQKTYVTTGENIGDKVAITSGLQPSDKVITEGQQKVSTGMAVKE